MELGRTVYYGKGSYDIVKIVKGGKEKCSWVPCIEEKS